MTLFLTGLLTAYLPSVALLFWLLSTPTAPKLRPVRVPARRPRG